MAAARALAAMHRAIAALEALAMMLVAIGLFTIMAVIVADVAARYFFRAPLPWAFDLISLYLMPAIFFLALSDTLQKDHHISVDLFIGGRSPRTQRALLVLASAVGSIVFLGIAWAAVGRMGEAWESGAVTSGIIQWPTWVSSAFVVAGAGLILLRLAFRAIAFALAALAGQAVPGAELPRRELADTAE